MHPHIFLLLLSCGVSSYFLSQKEMPHLLNKAEYALIDEMLCLLGAENEHTNGKFLTPVHITDLNCAHNNAQTFAKELKKIATRTCMKKVEEDMKKLEKKCDILKKSSNDKTCQRFNRAFPAFKKNLQEFLRWVNQKANCSSIERSELGLYLDDKCHCQKSLGGLG